MGFLARLEKDCLQTQNERDTRMVVITIDRNIKAILKTLLVAAPDDFKYIIAMNKYFKRELTQLTPHSFEMGLLEQFSDLTPFRNNQYYFDAEPSVTSPTVFVCLDEQTRDIDEEISMVLEPFNRSSISVEDGSATLYIYINVVDFLVYQTLREYVELIYPHAEIISEPAVTDGFNPDVHINVNLGDLSRKRTADIMQTFGGYLLSVKKTDESKIPFLSEVGQKLALTVPELIALASVYGADVQTSSRYAEPYGNYLASLWFDYDPSVKTFYEFVQDVYQAPSCIMVRGIVRYFGYIDAVRIAVTAVDVETKELLDSPLIIFSRSEVEPVFFGLQEHLEIDNRNTWDRLFVYKSRLYRVVSARTHLSTQGLDAVTGTKLPMKLEYSRNVSLLHDAFFPRLYNELCRKFKKARPACVPGKYLTYLARKQRLSAGQLPDWGLSPDEVDFWKPENLNIEASIRELTTLVSLETMIRHQQFDCRRGFLRPTILVRLNELGVRIRGQ